MIKINWSRFNYFVWKYGTILSVGLAGIALVISMGVFDSVLIPITPGLEDHGREADASMEPIHIEALSNQARLGLSSSVRFSNMKMMGMALGVATPQPVKIANDLSCQDWSNLLPSDGQPDTWTKAGPIQHITVHSAGTTGSATPQIVANWHVNGLGWEHIGYNFIITKDGVCHKTLPTGVMPYAQFRWNHNDVAVMLEGLDVFTEAQYSTLFKLVLDLGVQYKVPSFMIKGHRDWSFIDQADVRSGKPVANVNDHVDPCRSSTHCAWDDTQFGLRAALDNRANTSALPAPPTTPGATVQGVATYYAGQFNGRQTASGEVYDMYNENTTADFLRNGKTAWPFGQWLRVRDVKTGLTVDVKVNDTGNFAPPQLLDLSAAAYARIAGISVEDFHKTLDAGKNLGGKRDIEVTIISQDDYHCSYVAYSDHNVCGAFRDPYFNDQKKYGLPTDDISYSGQEATQHFSVGYTFKWANATGVQITHD